MSTVATTGVLAASASRTRRSGLTRAPLVANSAITLPRQRLAGKVLLRDLSGRCPPVGKSRALGGVPLDIAAPPRLTASQLVAHLDPRRDPPVQVQDNLSNSAHARVQHRNIAFAIPRRSVDGTRMQSSRQPVRRDRLRHCERPHRRRRTALVSPRRRLAPRQPGKWSLGLRSATRLTAGSRWRVGWSSNRLRADGGVGVRSSATWRGFCVFGDFTRCRAFDCSERGSGRRLVRWARDSRTRSELRGCAAPGAVTPWWLLGWRCCVRGSRGMFLSAPWCEFGSAGEHYLDLRSSGSMRSGWWALDDYSSAAGVPGAAARDPSEAALGGLQAGARRPERFAKQPWDGAARVGRDTVENCCVGLHVRADRAS
jgi:hypothetical protein